MSFGRTVDCNCVAYILANWNKPVQFLQTIKLTQCSRFFVLATTKLLPHMNVFISCRPCKHRIHQLDEDERRYASILLPLAKKRHQLLVTLLTANALAYEALPIFLDTLVPSWAAILLSTTIVMIFGEILPSAIFTGPDQLKLSSKVAPVVQLFLFVFYPWAVPLARLLDWIVQEDEHPEGYNRGELSALVKIQYEERFANKRRVNMREIKRQEKDAKWTALKKELFIEVDNDDLGEEQLRPPLHQQEVDLIQGALQMKTRLVMDVFTPLRHVYSIPDTMELDHDATAVIFSHGYTRIPVFRNSGDADNDDRVNVVGVLMTVSLLDVGKRY
jgi:metal transporter CNNM